MDSQHTWCVTFATLLYLALLFQPATGKCVGKWAIHACFGGNGKRSDPSLAETIDNRRESSLLRQILLPERFQSDAGLDMRAEEEEREDEPSLTNFDEELPERTDAERQRDIDKLNNMLRRLMLQRKIRLAARGLA